MKKEKSELKQKRKEKLEAYKTALKLDDKKFDALKELYLARRTAKKGATTDEQKKAVQDKWKEGVKALVGAKGLEKIREINQARKRK